MPDISLRVNPVFRSPDAPLAHASRWRRLEPETVRGSSCEPGLNGPQRSAGCAVPTCVSVRHTCRLVGSWDSQQRISIQRDAPHAALGVRTLLASRAFGACDHWRRRKIGGPWRLQPAATQFCDCIAHSGTTLCRFATPEDTCRSGRGALMSDPEGRQLRVFLQIALRSS